MLSRRLICQGHNDLFRQLSIFLREIPENLHIESRHNGRREVIVEQRRFVGRQYLKEGFVENYIWAHLNSLPHTEESAKVDVKEVAAADCVWPLSRCLGRLFVGIGFERDLYVHMQRGTPVSVETTINADIETPLSKSDTWQKIIQGREDALDASDKPYLYALIRHLNVRTPHALTTTLELAAMAADPNSVMEFAEEERAFYASLHNNPQKAQALFNAQASSLSWAERDYRHARMTIYRSPIRLRTATTPVMSLKVPEHKSLILPLPGMTPYQQVLPLSPTALLTLVQADFEDEFRNQDIPFEVAAYFNQSRAGLFAQFDTIRHMVTDREGLVDTMTWAPYDLVKDTPAKVVFRRRQTV